jgi:hypothetical protein
MSQSAKKWRIMLSNVEGYTREARFETRGGSIVAYNLTACPSDSGWRWGLWGWMGRRECVLASGEAETSAEAKAAAERALDGIAQPEAWGDEVVR